MFRRAAIGDLHRACSPDERLRPLWYHIASSADVVLLSRDVIDFALVEEAMLFYQGAQDNLKIPMAASLSNHEYTAGQTEEAAHLFVDAGFFSSG